MPQKRGQLSVKCHGVSLHHIQLSPFRRPQETEDSLFSFGKWGIWQAKRIWIFSSKFSLFLFPGIPSHLFYSIIRLPLMSLMETSRESFQKENVPPDTRLQCTKAFTCQVPFVCSAPHNHRIYAHTLHLNIKAQIHVREPFILTPRAITCTDYREVTTKCRRYYLLSPD